MGTHPPDRTAKQSSDSYLASENIKRETSPQEAAEAEKGMSKKAEKYSGGGDLCLKTS